MTGNVVMNCAHYWVVEDTRPGVKSCLKCGAAMVALEPAPHLAWPGSSAALFDARPEIDDDTLNAARIMMRAGACDVRVLPWNLLAGLVRRLDETLKRGLERDEQLKAQEEESARLREQVKSLTASHIETVSGIGVNHEEAAQLAHLRKHRSNLARCYLDLKATLDVIYKPSP